MNSIQVHLVSGFLGSGKTTAIVQACKLLLQQGKRVGVVSNDQGKYLVDTAFFRLNDLPAMEVNGGCFCCNYYDLENQLEKLVELASPEIIFAESVGSCADLVATVINPLIKFRHKAYNSASLSVFVDARLLRLRLTNQEMPFSDHVIYIFDQQIEETDFLIINKIDLLSTNEKQFLVDLACNRFPDKRIHTQNSLLPTDVQGWLQELDSGNGDDPKSLLSMNYQRYGEGEQRLAWMDGRIIFQTGKIGAGESAKIILDSFIQQVRQDNLSVGHAKFIFEGSSGGWVKKSVVWGIENQVVPEPFDLEGENLTVLINLRAEYPAENLSSWFSAIVDRAAEQLGGSWQFTQLAVFHPKFPQPVYRIAQNDVQYESKSG